MSLKTSFIGLAFTAAVCFTGTATQAAPVGPVAAIVKVAATDASPIETVDYRRCWWRYGERHCRWYGGAPYAYYGAVPFVGFSIYGGRRWGGYRRW